MVFRPMLMTSSGTFVKSLAGICLAVLCQSFFAPNQPAKAHASEADMLTTIEIIALDEDVSDYATFQSHNQKVVQNGRGIFLTYLKSTDRNDKSRWKLLWSKDQGKTFHELYESEGFTKAPCVETDELDNIYVMNSDWVETKTYFYKFLAEDEYRTHIATVLENVSGGKYAMGYDKCRKLIYYFLHDGDFVILNGEGALVRREKIVRHTLSNVLQYPHVYVEPCGHIHAAWTTQRRNTAKIHYWSLHHMVSTDGGLTWKRLTGEAIQQPVSCDESGESDLITPKEELNESTSRWLNNFIVANNRLHFAYIVRPHPPAVGISLHRYVSIDLKSSERSPVRDWELSTDALSGFFVSSPVDQSCPLYYVSFSEKDLTCLVSDDNGRNWRVYARGPKEVKFGAPYAIGGFREVTTDGYIIGTFTDIRPPVEAKSQKPILYFFKIKTGLSKVR
jgi:hypothetical protein